MKPIKKLYKKISRIIGPGFVTGASDDDPSGIATYSQTGAQFGYGQLWTAVFSIPFMIVVQEMCGRIGMVTGKGLSGVIKSHYPRSVLYFMVTLLLVANTINIGADLGAMASALQLLVDVPFIVLLLGITAFTLILEIFVSYHVYSRILKYLALSLFTYIAAVFIIKVDWQQVLFSTFVPTISFTQGYLLNIVAILGTSISPYLFFWQSYEEVEEEIESGKIQALGKGVPRITSRDLTAMRWDTVIGMFFSQIVMFFIIVTAASTLNLSGIFDIQTAAQAAEALRPIAGDSAFLLFTLGIVGTGLLAVPILAGSASYAISEAFNWKAGLSKKLKQAHGFYGVITIATILGLLVNFTPISPFKMLYYTAVLNGICAPPLILMILLISNNKKVMGKRVNTSASNFMGGFIALVMAVAAIGLFVL